MIHSILFCTFLSEPKSSKKLQQKHGVMAIKRKTIHNLVWQKLLPTYKHDINKFPKFCLRKYFQLTYRRVYMILLFFCYFVIISPWKNEYPSPKDVVYTKRMTDWWQMAGNQKSSLELSARVSYKQLRQWMWDKKVIGWKIYSFCLSFIFSPLSFFNFDHIIHVMKLPLIQEMESLQTLLQ